MTLETLLSILREHISVPSTLAERETMLRETAEAVIEELNKTADIEN